MVHIFYSWQSDLPNNTNRGFIEKALKKAVASLEKEDINIDIRIDQATQDVPGTPGIDSTIFDKISESQIFVCDVTPINSSLPGQYTGFLDWVMYSLNTKNFGLKKLCVPRSTGNRYNTKLTPNPNVMVELGYAAGCISWNQIICILNTAYAAEKELPFDIRNRRICTYHCPENLKDKSEERNKLTGKIKENIESIIASITNITFNQIAFEQLKNDLESHAQMLFYMFKASVKAVPEQKYRELEDFFDDVYYREIAYLNLSKSAVSFGSSRTSWDEYISSGCSTLKNSLTRTLDRYSHKLSSQIVALMESIINDGFIKLMLNIQALNAPEYNSLPRFTSLFEFPGIQETVRDHIEKFLKLVEIYNQNSASEKNIKMSNTKWDRWWDEHVQPHIGHGRI
ncbi:MAG TPA: hypothetical protein V6D28_10870 [Leptolyngbyaceae cyanobacterium]